MNKQIVRQEWALLLLCIVLVAMVFTTGILNQPKVWTNLALDYVEGRTLFTQAAGDEHGIVASGPYYDLPAGVYRIKWQLDGDGENIFHLRCTNDVEISPSEIRTSPGVYEDEAWFEIKGAAHNFAIDIEYAQGSWMEVYNIRLYTPEYTDHAWSFAFVLLAVWLLFVTWKRGFLTEQRFQTLILLAVAVFFVSLPSLRQDAVMSIDSQFHMARIMNLADALAAGQFPARVGGYSYNGYGAVTSVFYPDLGLYLSAVMMLGGTSMAYAVNVYCIICHMLAAVTMYAAAKRIFKCRKAATCAAILYVCALYRLLDVYRRFMAGEMIAMSVIPLFLLGLWEVFFAEKKRWPILVIGATLVFRNHVLSTVICAGIAGFLGIIFMRRLICQKRMGAVLKAVIFTLLINLNALVPMLTLYGSGVNSAPTGLNIEESTFEIWQVVTGNGWQSIAAWIGAVAVFCCETTEKNRSQLRLARVLAILGIAISLMTTELFPWSHAVKLTGGLLNVLQFTSRFLIIAAPFMAVAGGYGLAQVFKGRGVVAEILTLVIAVYPIMPYIEQVLGQGTLEFGKGANPFMYYREYQIEGTDTTATRERDVLSSGDVQLTEYEKSGTRIMAQVDAKEDALLEFPLFGFEGYAVELDGERIEWTRGENNRLMVQIPAGTQAGLKIWYEGKLIWYVADAVSLCAFLYLIAHMWRKKGHA